MVPLSDTRSASDPTLIDSAEQHEHFMCQCISDIAFPWHVSVLWTE